MRAGRFGAYVNHGKTNATLKASAAPETITLEEAIRLIEDKEAAGGGKRKAPAPKRSAPKAPISKTSASKTSASNRKAPPDDGSPPFETTAETQISSCEKTHGR